MAGVEKIEDFASKFDYWTGQPLEKLAKAKKSKKKTDPKAKVRNRGTVVFPANSKSVKDKKDHFPINNEGQARNALARSHQYSSTPSWYRGSLKSLQEAVRRKVHGKYPKIQIADKKKKKSSLEALMTKYS